ncbi:MAG: hypothetical protein AAGU74_12745 [Bacillota bacterium]
MDTFSPLQRLEQDYPSLLPTINLSIERAYAEIFSMLTPTRRKHPIWKAYFPFYLYPAIQAGVLAAVNELNLPGIVAESKMNAAGNCPYVKISTTIASITVHCTCGSENPRSAVYRNSLANGQQNWFYLFDEETGDSPAYLAVTHQMNKKDLSLRDIRIMLLSKQSWHETINESIADRRLPVEHIHGNVAVQAKEEIIEQHNMPLLKNIKAD